MRKVQEGKVGSERIAPETVAAWQVKNGFIEQHEDRGELVEWRHCASEPPPQVCEKRESHDMTARVSSDREMQAKTGTEIKA